MFLRLFKYLWPERYLPEIEQDDPFNEDPPPRAPGKVGVLLVNLGTPDTPVSYTHLDVYKRQTLASPAAVASRRSE